MNYKFRAFDKLKKVMIAEGFHVIGEVTMFSIIDQYCMENAEGKPLLERYGDIEVMQWTGHQINGVYLYDLDIIRNEKFGEEDEVTEYFVCVYIQEWAMFGLLTVDEYNSYKEDGAEALDYTDFWTFPIDDKENEQRRICGNIYENENLLQTT